MENKKINVKAHKRFDPRLNKKVNVDSYNKNQRFTPYKSNITSGLPLAKGLTANNIGYIQYKILELIKLNANYDAKTKMSDLYDELTFGIENEKAIRDMVKNLRSQGLLNKKSLTPTKEGDRVFWEFFNEFDEDNEAVALLKDNPDWKKEGFEITGSKEYPNETLLYLKDLDKK